MGKTQECIIFVKDQDLSKPGFKTYEEAKLVADKVKQDNATRVRVSFRSRTNSYDVVVKKARQVVVTEVE